MAGIPTRTVESKTIIGNELVAVRQRVKLAAQFNGVAPVITGPPQIDPLDGAYYADGVYMYSDIQPECLIGDPADVNAQVVLKALNTTVDGLGTKVVMSEGAALTVRVGAPWTIFIEYVPGTTTYALLQAALAADANVAAAFSVTLPGTGAPFVAAGTPKFVQPTVAQAVQDDGGVFAFTPGPRNVTLKSVSLVCGAGSTVDVYLQDKGGANPRKILAAVSGAADEHAVDVPFLATEEVMVQETASGVPVGSDKYVTLYLVKEQVL